MSNDIINGVKFTQTKLRPNGSWVWVTDPTWQEIVSGISCRRATSAEARGLNRRKANDPDVMSFSGTHPSYRV